MIGFIKILLTILFLLSGLVGVLYTIGTIVCIITKDEKWIDFWGYAMWDTAMAVIFFCSASMI